MSSSAKVAAIHVPTPWSVLFRVTFWTTSIQPNMLSLSDRGLLLPTKFEKVRMLVLQLFYENSLQNPLHIFHTLLIKGIWLLIVCRVRVSRWFTAAFTFKCNLFRHKNTRVSVNVNDTIITAIFSIKVFDRLPVRVNNLETNTKTRCSCIESTISVVWLEGISYILNM